jgi:tRNA/tmRNA/rRNA uracil-C5-methylase (TrmA/RlmC/RlmD family)
LSHGVSSNGHELGSTEEIDIALRLSPQKRSPAPPSPFIARKHADPQASPVMSERLLLELEAGPIAAGGGCVARAEDGRVVFVRHCLPGERVLAAITEETRSYFRADAVEIIDPSPDRVSAPCPYAGQDRCGGCDWQHIALGAQRRLKADLVAEQLGRVAGVEMLVKIDEIPGAPDGLGWRTRVRFSVDEAGRVGLHKHRSHDLQLLERCLIASPAVQRLGVETLEWRDVAELEVFASSSGERVLSISTRNRRVKHLPEIDAGLVVNGRVARQPESLVFEVLGRRYRVSAGVFWQVHPGAAEVLGRAVLDGLEPRVGDQVADLYSGAGLFTALVGDAVGPAGSVLAVERDRWACADAATNTADQLQVEIFKAAVTPALVTHRLAGVDLVVLDPSREGAGRAVMDALAALQPGPRRIVYVACDPASFARDLRVLLDAGWRVSSLRGFDMFPMTEHVELVAVIDPP